MESGDKVGKSRHFKAKSLDIAKWLTEMYGWDIVDM